MLESLRNFFKRMGKKEDEELLPSSSDAAKERLHLVLMQDRVNISVDFLDMMKQELIDVVKRYIDIDEKEMDVRLTNQINEDGTNGAPALYANIPIVGIKAEKTMVLNNNVSKENDNTETNNEKTKVSNKKDSNESSDEEEISDENKAIKKSIATKSRAKKAVEDSKTTSEGTKTTKSRAKKVDKTDDKEENSSKVVSTTAKKRATTKKKEDSE